jgi:hypothetical protein
MAGNKNQKSKPVQQNASAKGADRILSEGAVPAVVESIWEELVREERLLKLNVEFYKVMTRENQ